MRFSILIFFAVALALFFGCGQVANTAGTTTTTLFPTSTLPSGGTIYYVSPSSDSTVLATAGALLKPGDTLIIRGGRHILKNYDDRLVSPSGTPEGWITIKGEDGNRPTLEGQGSLLAAVDITGKNNLIIENLEITSNIDSPYTGGLREGIEAGGSAGTGTGDVENIIMRNLLIRDVEDTGINFAGSIRRVTLEAVHIHHTGGTIISAPAAGAGKNGWENVLISGCTLEYAGVFYQGQERRSTAERPDGLGMESSDGPLEIKNSVARYNFGDGFDSKTKRTYIHDSISANNFGDGLKLWGDGSRAERCLVFGTNYVSTGEVSPGSWALLVIDQVAANASFEVVNCTFFDDDRRVPNYAFYAQYASASPIKLTLRNNIFSGVLRGSIGSGVNLTAQNNLFFNRDPSGVQLEVLANESSPPTRTYTTGEVSTLGSGNIYGNPKFVRPEWGPDGDFRLQPGSPALDAGTPAGVDIGAYEK